MVLSYTNISYIALTCFLSTRLFSMLADNIAHCHYLSPVFYFLDSLCYLTDLKISDILVILLIWIIRSAFIPLCFSSPVNTDDIRIVCLLPVAQPIYFNYPLFISDNVFLLDPILIRIQLFVQRFLINYNINKLKAMGMLICPFVYFMIWYSQVAFFFYLYMIGTSSVFNFGDIIRNKT